MKSKRNIVLGVVSICILLVALTLALLEALVPFQIWPGFSHPTLDFLLCIFVGFGVMTLVFAFEKRSPWYFFLTASLLAPALFYVLIHFIPWWICLIVVFVLWAVSAIVSFMRAGNQTEDIALNKSPDYKNYEQRKAEESKEEKPEKELPKIKSFKD